MSKQWRSWPLHVVCRRWIQDETKHKRPRPRQTETAANWRRDQDQAWTPNIPEYVIQWHACRWCQSADCWNVDDIWSSHFTTDAFLAIQLLSELHQQFILLLYLAFGNIKSDFDSTDMNALWKALHVKAVTDILLHLFKDLYCHTVATVGIDNKFLHRFSAISAVLQRYVLAALNSHWQDFRPSSTRCGHCLWTLSLVDFAYADSVATVLSSVHWLLFLLLKMFPCCCEERLMTRVVCEMRKWTGIASCRNDYRPVWSEIKG